MQDVRSRCRSHSDKQKISKFLVCLQVLGAHMVGPDSAEIMQGIAIALKAGAKKVLPFHVHFKELFGRTADRAYGGW